MRFCCATLEECTTIAQVPQCPARPLLAQFLPQRTFAPSPLPPPFPRVVERFSLNAVCAPAFSRSRVGRFFSAPLDTLPSVAVKSDSPRLPLRVFPPLPVDRDAPLTPPTPPPPGLVIFLETRSAFFYFSFRSVQVSGLFRMPNEMALNSRSFPYFAVLKRGLLPLRTVPLLGCVLVRF